MTKPFYMLAQKWYTMTKQVKISKKVHERLSKIKEKTNAHSYNDVINSLIQISEEFYTNKGKLNTQGKKILLKYDDGNLTEIEITNQKKPS